MKLILSLLLGSILLFSCTKQVEHPPVSKENLLTNKVWQVKHLYSVQNNIVYFYERGGSNNTYNYDNDYLKFEKDGSGTYTAGYVDYHINWQFDNSDKSELSYTIHNYANGGPADGVDHQMKLENVYISENLLRYAEIYTNQNGTNTVSSVYREPAISGGH